MNLISVIVPVFNAEKQIERCIKSIQNQTYTNIEIIIINDGSTDKSIDIINKCIHDDNRVKVFDIVNQGVSAARNLGIKVASGEYFCFIDADDYVDECLIEKIINYTERRI